MTIALIPASVFLEAGILHDCFQLPSGIFAGGNRVSEEKMLAYLVIITVERLFCRSENVNTSKK